MKQVNTFATGKKRKVLTVIIVRQLKQMQRMHPGWFLPKQNIGFKRKNKYASFSRERKTRNNSSKK